MIAMTLGEVKLLGIEETIDELVRDLSKDVSQRDVRGILGTGFVAGVAYALAATLPVAEDLDRVWRAMGGGDEPIPVPGVNHETSGGSVAVQPSPGTTTTGKTTGAGDFQTPEAER